MRDWDTLKEEIRQRIDLVEVVSEHVSLKRAGRDFIGLCPFHEEKTPSFSVSPSKQIFKCFGCGVGGDLFSFVQQREAVNFVESMRILADRAGVDLEQARRKFGEGANSGRDGGVDRSDIARANAWAMEAFQNALGDEQIGGIARNYLKHRGISHDIVEQFAIGWAPQEGSWLPNQARKMGVDIAALKAGDLVRQSDQGGGNEYGVFRGRLMFPIRDTMNRVIGFGGRTLVDDRAKYLNTSHTSLFDKGQMLYGIDQARIPMSEKRQVIVVEGYTDCIACHQFGLTRAVATLGTALTDQQISLLRRWCDEVVLLFDADAAGEKAADRALGVALRHNLSVRIAKVPDGKDPSDYLTAHGPAGIDSLLNGAVDALRFKWGRTCEQFGGQAGRSQGGSNQREAVEAFISLVSQMASYGTLDAIQRGLVINQLSGLLSVPSDDVVKLLSDAQKKSRSRSAANYRQSRDDQQFGGIPSSVPDGGIKQAASSDAEQAALKGMLQVLVNGPGFYGEVSDIFDPLQLHDPAHRRVAQEVVGLCNALGEFSVSELMDRTADEPLLTRLVTDLVYEGERQGQYGAVIEDTRDRLRRLGAVREGRRLADSLCRDALNTEHRNEESEVESLQPPSVVQGDGGGDLRDDGNASDRLEQLQQLLSKRHGFAPGVPAANPVGLVRPTEVLREDQ